MGPFPINPLGFALQSALRGTEPPTPAPQVPQMSKGQIIAGILSDVLAGAMGKPVQFAPMMQARQQRQEDREQKLADWGLQRRERLEDYEAQKKIDQRYQQPDVSPMERDVAAWARMSPEQRTTYQQMKQMNAPDPDVFITLPNGQVYAGPRSGLAAAMTGGAPTPAKPVGKLTPINGGPAPQAPGMFP